MIREKSNPSRKITATRNPMPSALGAQSGRSKNNFLAAGTGYREQLCNECKMPRTRGFMGHERSTMTGWLLWFPQAIAETLGPA
jgi:hypothetical protein